MVPTLMFKRAGTFHFQGDHTVFINTADVSGHNYGIHCFHVWSLSHGFQKQRRKYLNYIIKTNAERMKDWTKDGSTFVVDRGVRDSCDMLRDLGINIEMPLFLSLGASQLPTEDANCSKLVTKVQCHYLHV